MAKETKRVDYNEYNTSDKNKYDSSVPSTNIEQIVMNKELFITLLMNIAACSVRGTSKDVADVTVPDIMNYLYNDKNIDNNSVGVMRMYKE